MRDELVNVSLNDLLKKFRRIPTNKAFFSLKTQILIDDFQGHVYN